MNTPLPAAVIRALRQLGADVSVARRRRQLTQASLAECIGASTMTVRRMEKGNPLIPMQYLARALFVFGELERLNRLLDTAVDGSGMNRLHERLPARVRNLKRGECAGRR